MKKGVFILILIACTLSSCIKQQCYTCSKHYFGAAHVDTFSVLGQMKFDTVGGAQSTSVGPDFKVCSAVPGYYYDIFSQPYSTVADTLVICYSIY